MQTLHCTVRLGGKITHTVRRTHITVAELTILRVVHGGDAIVELEPGPMLAAPDAALREKERLAMIYGGKLVLEVFPGLQRVPVSFADVGLTRERASGRLVALSLEECGASAELVTSSAQGVQVAGAEPAPVVEIPILQPAAEAADAESADVTDVVAVQTA